MRRSLGYIKGIDEDGALLLQLESDGSLARIISAKYR
jgi:hypothetical protein